MGLVFVILRTKATELWEKFKVRVEKVFNWCGEENER